MSVQDCTITYAMEIGGFSASLKWTLLESGRWLGHEAFSYSAYTPAFSRVLLFTRGRATLQTHTATTQLEVGMIYVLPVHHSFTITYEEDTELCFFHFTSEDALGRDPLGSVKSHLELADPQLFSRIVTAYGPQRSERSSPWEAVLFEAVCRLLWPMVPQARSRGEGLPELHSLLEHIVEDASPEMTVQELAEWAGVSRYVLSRVFRRDLGVSPKQYVLLVLMQRARELLLTTDLSIREVASMLGYDDVCYFSRAFKSQVGGSPLGFRQSARDEIRQPRP